MYRVSTCTFRILKLPQNASAFIIHYSNIFIIQRISNVELSPAFSKKLFIHDGLPFLLMLPSQTTKQQTKNNTIYHKNFTRSLFIHLLQDLISGTTVGLLCFVVCQFFGQVLQERYTRPQLVLLVQNWQWAASNAPRILSLFGNSGAHLAIRFGLLCSRHLVLTAGSNVCSC